MREAKAQLRCLLAAKGGAPTHRERIPTVSAQEHIGREDEVTLHNDDTPPLDIACDLHTHSTYSHGKGSVADNAASGDALGLLAVGIADHGLGHVLYGLHRWDLKKLRREVDEYNAAHPGGCRVLMGVEANLVSMDGCIDMRDEEIELFDFRLLGLHPSVWFRGLRNTWHFFLHSPCARSASGKAKVRERNTRAVCRAMERYPIDCITHPNMGFKLNMQQVCETAARTGTALEISAKHSGLDAPLLAKCKAWGAKFIIGSDAHSPQKVGKWDNAIQRALDAGLVAQDILNVRGNLGRIKSLGKLGF